MTPTQKKKAGASDNGKRVTLKAVASQLGLTPGTVSATLNNSPAARSIPERTKQRIFAAARELNYRPNFFARTLRVKRTFTIGLIAEEIGDAYGSQVISGIEKYLTEKNYFFLTVVHRHDRKQLQTYSQMLVERGVEGIITVDTNMLDEASLPTVAVAGHHSVAGVTNIVLDHKRAARFALEHLKSLGHEDIAFLQGQVLSADSEDRWNAIVDVAADLNIRIRPELTLRIESIASTPEVGFPVAEELLARKQHFTALFAFNDNSAIGAIWALKAAGLRVPEDVSVVGFDDIPAAQFANPSLTTVRQPLVRMGEIAAQTLVNQIEEKEEYVPAIAIEPEFVVRNSTARPAMMPRAIGTASR
ncbi:MAG TPA: LacI family DNA-binding transcriptional regulator [Candidatus Methylomirabilis sp.]|nr:LacI family DNA-binding transcriptional regulator [Candidatus Methylomirabilis sp.]